MQHELYFYMYAGSICRMKYFHATSLDGLVLEDAQNPRWLMSDNGGIEAVLGGVRHTPVCWIPRVN